MVARIAFENGFDAFRLKGSDNALRAVGHAAQKAARRARLSVAIVTSPGMNHPVRTYGTSPARIFSASLRDMMMSATAHTMKAGTPIAAYNSKKY